MEPKRTVKIQNVEFASEISFIDLESLSLLEGLQKKCDWILEDSQAHYLLKDKVAFRVFKPGATPNIMKTKRFEASPDYYKARVEVSPEVLLDFAKTYSLIVFLNEATQELLLPGDTFLYATKKGERP